MKVLVTGGSGYVGSTLTLLLLEQGYQVRVIDDLLYGGGSLVVPFSHPQFEFMRADLRDVDMVTRALQDMNAVVHLAAIVGDPACERRPLEAREVNLHASLRLFELSQRKGVERFIFASTCSNYGRMPDTSEFIREESELRPLSLYATLKVGVEKVLLDTSNGSEIAATVLRFATVFGVSPRMRFDLTVNEFTRELLTRRKLIVFGEQFWRPYIHVGDAARAITIVLKAPLQKVRRQVFNVGDTSQNYRKEEIIELIRTQVGGDVQIERIHREEDPRDYRVSFEKIKKELNFYITRTVKEGISEVIDAITQGIITDPYNPHYRN